MTGAVPPPPEPEPPDAPPSDDFSQELLGIDPQRLLQIVDDFCTRCDEVREAMGVVLGQAEPRFGSWAWWRRIARSEYGGEYIWRQNSGLGGVFEASGGNLSLGVSNRFVRLLAARHAENQVGTDPFLAIMPATPENPEDADLSKAIEEKVQYEITRSNLQPVLAESIRVALNQGEVPIKLSWVTEKTQRPETRPVAVYLEAAAGDPMEGAPLDGSAPMEGNPLEGTAPSVPGLDAPEESAEIPGVDDETAEPPNLPPVPGLDAAPTADATPSPFALSPSPSSPPRPIKTPRGHFIYPSDATVLTLHDDVTDAYEGIHPAGADVPVGKHVKVRLKKEPEFIFDETMLDLSDAYNPKPIFQPVPGLMAEDVQRDGLMAAGLPFEDFLYDIYAPTLDDSDIQCHVFDEDLDNVLAAYGVPEDPTDRYTAMLRSLATDIPKSSQSAPKHDQGESLQTTGSRVRRKVNLHEGYYRVRLRPEDRWPTWLFLVVDLERKVPLHAEYLGNMRMKKPPFGLLRGLETEPGRAYGVGLNKKFHKRQLAVDFWFNQAKLKTAKEDSADFYYPDAFHAMQDGQPFMLGTQTIYPLIADSTREKQYGPDHPPVFRVNLHETNDKEWDLIEKLIQTGQIEFGIADIGQLQDEGAAIAKDATATATRNVERTGNTLQRSTEFFMTLDITDICNMATELILENADVPQSRFSPDGTLIAGLDRDEIREIDRDVRLLLTKARSAESLATNQQVIAAIKEYYALPKALQKKAHAAFVNILKSLDVQAADEVLTEPTDEDIAAEAQAAAQPPKESLSINYKDAPADIRRQMETAAGFKPSQMDVPPPDAGAALSPASTTPGNPIDSAPVNPLSGPAAGQPPGAIPQHTASDPTHTAPFAMAPAA